MPKIPYVSFRASLALVAYVCVYSAYGRPGWQGKAGPFVSRLSFPEGS